MEEKISSDLREWVKMAQTPAYMKLLGRMLDDITTDVDWKTSEHLSYAHINFHIRIKNGSYRISKPSRNLLNIDLRGFLAEVCNDEAVDMDVWPIYLKNEKDGISGDIQTENFIEFLMANNVRFKIKNPEVDSIVRKMVEIFKLYKSLNIDKKRMNVENLIKKEEIEDIRKNGKEYSRIMWIEEDVAGEPNEWYALISLGNRERYLDGTGMERINVRDYFSEPLITMRTYMPTTENLKIIYGYNGSIGILRDMFDVDAHSLTVVGALAHYRQYEDKIKEINKFLDSEIMQNAVRLLRLVE